MLIQIEEAFSGKSSWMVVLSAGRESVCVTKYHSHGGVTVCVRNASSNAWRGRFGAGRMFRSVDSAIEAYKRADVKELIRFAVEHARTLPVS